MMKNRETKKPPFKVGKVHHKYYSPPVLIKSKRRQCHAVEKTTKNSPIARRITRATEKRMIARNATSAKTDKPIKSFAAKDYQFVPPKINHQIFKSDQVKIAKGVDYFNFELCTEFLKPSPLNETFEKKSDESINSSWSLKVFVDEEDKNSTVLNISTSSTISGNSPSITKSTGKKEKLRRSLRYMNSNEIPTKKTVMQNLKRSTENKENAIQFNLVSPTVDWREIDNGKSNKKMRNPGVSLKKSVFDFEDNESVELHTNRPPYINVIPPSPLTNLDLTNNSTPTTQRVLRSRTINCLSDPIAPRRKSRLLK